MLATVDCLFCKPSDKSIVLSNDLCYASWDSYPVNPGHMLIIPFRHFPDYFEATTEEKAALWRLLDDAKTMIDREYKPDGLNVGVNIGKAAGQSVFHVHMHLIPRYRGDVPDPKGGVRSVLPHKRRY